MTTPARPGPQAERKPYDLALAGQDAWLAAHEDYAERTAQEAAGLPWADGPDRTYEQMERDDAAFAARQARRAREQPEAEAEADAVPW